VDRELSHEQAWPELPAAAVDALAPDERAAVLAHAEQCATCGPELSVLREAAGELAFAVPSWPVDRLQRERMRDRLIARAAADRPRDRADARARPRPRGARDPRWVGWLAAAALAGLVATSALLVASRVRRDGALADAQSAYADAARRADSLGALLADREQLVGSLSGSDVAVVEMASGGSRAPRGRMFWDRATNRWTFFAHNLPAPPTGRTYQLWLVTPTARISAGTFAPRDREALVRAEYALPRDSLRAVAVTEEPAGGVAQPTGAIVLIGEMRD
jgi:hypothetical protein